VDGAGVLAEADGAAAGAGALVGSGVEADLEEAEADRAGKKKTEQVRGVSGIDDSF